MNILVANISIPSTLSVVEGQPVFLEVSFSAIADSNFTVVVSTAPDTAEGLVLKLCIM